VTAGTLQRNISHALHFGVEHLVNVAGEHELHAVFLNELLEREGRVVDQSIDDPGRAMRNDEFPPLGLVGFQVFFQKCHFGGGEGFGTAVIEHDEVGRAVVETVMRVVFRIMPEVLFGLFGPDVVIAGREVKGQRRPWLQEGLDLLPFGGGGFVVKALDGVTRRENESWFGGGHVFPDLLVDAGHMLAGAVADQGEVERVGPGGQKEKRKQGRGSEGLQKNARSHSSTLQCGLLRTVRATRYVTPLREGGSLPAIVEADDCGLYVLKFFGAGQGPLALVAELISGEIGRALGVRVPEIVLVETDEALGRNEPDQEIRELLLASTGVNLALDYLPGSIMFDPAVKQTVDPSVASEAVWFDSFITNVDRTARNANLLWWHKALYFIDHGASLYFHHNWENVEAKALNPFAAVRDHVLLKWASQLEAADAALRPRLSERVFEGIVSQVPEAWLPPAGRAGYVAYLTKRLENASVFVEEARRARGI
jgi:hypothetical protein